MRTIAIGSTRVHDVTDPSVHLFAYSPIAGVGAAPQRIVEFIRAGEDGAYVANVFQGQRVISIPGRIVAQDADDYYALRRQVSELAIPSRDAGGNLLPKLCTFTNDDGTALTIPGQVTNVLLPDELMRSAPYSFDIKCQDWFFSSQAAKVLNLQVATGGGVVLPVVLPAVSATGSGNSGSLSNSGDVAAFPAVTVQGPLTNPRIYNLTTNQYSAFALTLGPSDVLTVSMAQKTASLNGGSAMQYLVSGSTWWTLPPGSSSILFTSSTPVDTGTVAVSFYDAYSGI